jgi:hypothetical protein
VARARAAPPTPPRRVVATDLHIGNPYFGPLLPELREKSSVYCCPPRSSGARASSPHPRSRRSPRASSRERRAPLELRWGPARRRDWRPRTPHPRACPALGITAGCCVPRACPAPSVGAAPPAVVRAGSVHTQPGWPPATSSRRAIRILWVGCGQSESSSEGLWISSGYPHSSYSKSTSKKNILTYSTKFPYPVIL